jgi:hypothetical protein
MSFHRNRRRIRPRPMGDAVDIVKTGAAVVTDPYFNEVICRVGQLQLIEAGKPPGDCVTTPPNLGGGVGLRRAMPAVRAFVKAEQYRPWSYVAGAAVVFGLPMLIGYALGKGS